MPCLLNFIKSYQIGPGEGKIDSDELEYIGIIQEKEGGWLEGRKIAFSPIYKFSGLISQHFLRIKISIPIIQACLQENGTDFNDSVLII